MTSTEVKEALKELPPALRFAFAPLVKRALGFAVGIVFGGTLFLVTIYHLIFGPELDFHLWLLANYFFGYDPESWSGPFFFTSGTAGKRA